MPDGAPHLAGILYREGFGITEDRRGVRVLERIYSWTVKKRISESRRWPFPAGP